MTELYTLRDYEEARRRMWERIKEEKGMGKNRYCRELGLNPSDIEPEKSDYTRTEAKLIYPAEVLRLEPIELNSLPTVTVYDDWESKVNTGFVDRISQSAPKEESMYAQAQVSIDTAKDYLMHRLYDIREDKRVSAREHYKIDGITPKSVKETKEWLKSGNYHFDIPDWMKEDGNCLSTMGYLVWGKDAPDTDAYFAELDAVKDAYQAALDIVSVKTDEDERLKALKAFEAKKFH